MKRNKIIFGIVGALVVGIVATRIAGISNENSRVVYNAARAWDKDGAPVETMFAKTSSDTLREPVAVRRGRIYVSGARVHKFDVGQKLSGGGTITSVSKKIDLDTGLYVMRTNAASGNHFVEIPHTGVFVPLYAIHNDAVMVVKDDMSAAKRVTIVASDAERAVVKGLVPGDEIILTKISENVKIRKNK
ncbi:MAG: hypothetical protein FWG39_02580 [Alphaproteobacteria bacterium]|nr:hypothetical protein [Alphaproteobacteria bacterium]